MPMTPLAGFLPDQPTHTPGVMVACTNIVPTEVGFAGGPDASIVTGVPALASACRGGVVALKTDGTRRTFAGTQTRLYELVSSAWSDVSRGAFYTGSSDNRWVFAQFGNTTLAANSVAPIQASNGSGAFADIALAPVAKIVFTAGDFALALNTSDGTYGTQGDRWWCSGIFDATQWGASISTQANTGRLLGGGGDFTAGLALGKQAVAYKAKGMWLGNYVGGTVVWQWDQIAGEQGAVGPEAVADANGVHVFVGDDNIWGYDGVRAVPLADNAVRQWFFSTCSPAYRFRTIVQFERQNNRIWIFFPGAGSTDGTPDTTLVYHLSKKRWGRADRSIQAALSFVQPGLTYDTLNLIASSYDTLPAVSYDSQFWLAGGRSLAVFDATGQIRTLTGSSASSSFTTGDIGDDWVASRLSQARLRFLDQPTTATCSGQVFSNIGAAPYSGPTATIRDGKFDIRQSGRWHRLTFAFAGDVIVTDIDHDLTRAGGR